MNERIRLLAQQAGMYVDLGGNSWPKSMSAEECEAAYAKFAELIVRECVGVCDDERDSTDSEFGKLVAEGCALKIMERFGVE